MSPFVILSSLMATVSTLINGSIFIFTILHIKTIDPTMACLAGLFMSDIFTGVISLPIFITLHQERIGLSYGIRCPLSISAMLYFPFVSLTHQTLLIVDRIIAITFSSRCDHVVLTRAMSLAMILCWALPCILCLPIVIEQRMNITHYQIKDDVCSLSFINHSGSTINIVLISVMVLIMICIVLNLTLIPILWETYKVVKNEMPVRLFSKELSHPKWIYFRSMMIGTAKLSSILITWLPIVIFLLMTYFGFDINTKEDILNICCFVLLSRSIINPLLYGLTTRRLQQAFIDMIKSIPSK